MNTKQMSAVGAAIAIVLVTAGGTAAATDVPPPRQSAAQTVATNAGTVSTWSGNFDNSMSTVTGTVNGVAGLIEHNASNAAARAKVVASMSHNPVTQTGYTAMAQHTFQQGMARADGIRDAIAPLEKAGEAVSMVSYAATGTQIAGQVVAGNYNDAAIAAGQLATEEAVSRGGAHLANAVCGPPCAAMYGAGNAAGSLIKQVDTCAFRDCGPGKSYTIEDGVTDGYFAMHQKVIFALDPSKDPMSDEFAAKALAQIQANKDRYAQRSGELLIQQQQLDEQRAAAAAAAAPVSTPTGTADPGNGFTDLLTALVDGAVQYQQLQSTYAPPSQGRAKSSSSSGTATGCHPGHDEQAHPGGCLDYGGVPSN